MDHVLFDKYILIGGGSSQPGVYLISKEIHKKKLVDFDDRGGRGLAIQSVALSPNARFFAAMTRPSLQQGRISFPSIVRVYSVNNSPEIQLERLPNNFEYHFHEDKKGACDFDISDDGQLAVACGNGGIYLFSPLTLDKPVFEFQPHKSYIYSVAWLNQGRALVSFGEDGRLQIFDMAQNAKTIKTHQIPPPTAYPILCSLGINRHSDIVYAGDGTGTLHVISAYNDEVKKIEAHKNSILAVAYHPETNQILTADTVDFKLKAWNAESYQIENEIQHSNQILGVLPLLNQECAIVDAVGLSIYNLKDTSISPMHINGISPRTWSTPDFHGEVIQRRKEHLNEINRLKETGRQAVLKNDEKKVQECISELARHGYGVDASLLHLSLLRVKGQLLKEYVVWQDLINKVEILKGNPAVTYLYAELLEKLFEYAEAIKLYDSIKGYRDAVHKMEKLKKSPLSSDTRNDLVRCDFSKPEQVIEEIEKCNIMNRPYFLKTMIQKDTPITVKNLKISPLLFCEKLNRDRQNWVVETENRFFYTDEKIEELETIKLKHSTFSNPPNNCVEFVFSFHPNINGNAINLSIVFNPMSNYQAAMDLKLWNQKVLNWWKEVWTSSAIKEAAVEAKDYFGQQLDFFINEF